MKKLIIALGAMAIANSSFISPVRADYRAEEYKEAVEYVKIFGRAEYNFKTLLEPTNLQATAERLCTLQNFDEMMDELKFIHRVYYSLLIVILNNKEYKNNMVSFFKKIKCPNGEIQFPVDF